MLRGRNIHAFCLGLLCAGALLVCLPINRIWSEEPSTDEAKSGVAEPRTKDSPSQATNSEQTGYFFALAGAKDCAFDESRQRLYVTNDKQLLVLDTKTRKLVDTIDLAGGPRACDISSDFKTLAVAAKDAHFIYWIELEEFSINQVRFEAAASETGVYDLCIGADNSVLFSMSYAGSGWVQLRRFDPQTQRVEPVQRVRMNTIVSTSGDRRYAAVAEGNISSGPLGVYDFSNNAFQPVTKLGLFFYEIACSADGRHFAVPQAKGCQLCDQQGGKLSMIGTKPIICAAFHPQADRLYLLQSGQSSIQEYDFQRGTLSDAFALSKPLAIKGDVSTGIIGHVVPTGPNSVHINVREVVSVHYRTFASGRLKFSASGKHLFAVLPTGVYMFDVSVPAGKNEKASRHPIKVIQAK